MKRFLFLYVFFLMPVIMLANAAAPGFRSAGGTGTFSLLYPDDSAKYQHIQMVREKVSIELYKGYAVVKGEYWMYNHADSSFSVRVGYPLNADYTLNGTSDYLTTISFDELYNLKALSNKVLQSIVSEPVNDPRNENEQKNWYIWNNTFKAKDTTYIEVYFIVNTNQAVVSKGYNKDKTNGFIYVLETGATWKQPIVQGEIRVRLMDGLDINDIRGILPGQIFGVNKNILVTEFQNLTPNRESNIIIAYSKRVTNLDFGNITRNSNVLYRSIDEFSNFRINKTELEPYAFSNPYEVKSWGGGFFTSLLMLMAIWGIPILIVVAIVWAIFFFIKNRKKSL